jgi:hypothetical protein
MPTRLLKESICTSKDINRLTPEQEVFFYRLIVNCDDHGYFQADPGILRGNCFPRRIDLISNEIICQWLQALVINELVIVFEADGCFYLRMPSWEKHQQVRAKRHKYPELDNSRRILQADEITCKHLISDDNKCPRNPIQSNPIQTIAPSRPTTKKTVDQEFLDSMKAMFPGIDVDLEWQHCQVWCTEKRKKPSPLRLMNWLKNAKPKQSTEGKDWNARG